MNFKYARNDLRKNWGANLSLFVVLVLSALLMATGAMVMERLSGAVNGLFEEAKPPHFLQMHKGDYDTGALDAFAAEHPEIESWLIEDMIGFDSSFLSWERPATGETGDLSESLIDNLFVVQNEEFDFLLDETNSIPQAAEGEVYVPVAYQQTFGLEAGDELSIRTDAETVTLTVEGFVRDAQMASSLSSATRFLVSAADFDRLSAGGGGIPEIIVEYLTTDPALGGALQTAYEANEQLPMNGQGVTFDIIRVINVFSEGLVAIALMFVSVLLIAIALLNVRFVIRGTLQDEVREIGAMKAIGLPSRTISGLYLSKYTVMTLLACAVGGVLAIFASRALTSSVQANFAEAPVTAATFIAPIAALLAVFVLVISIAWGVLRAVDRIEVVSALVHGSTLTEKQTARKAKRSGRGVIRSVFRGYRGGNMNAKLARVDLRTGFGQWVLIPVVFALAAVLVALPMSLLNTFQSQQFVSYLGAPESDMRIDLQYSEDVAATYDEVAAALAADDRFSEVTSYANVAYEIEGESGWEIFRTEVGDYSGNTVAFAPGSAPEEGQIALSALNAENLQVGVGDTITLRDGEELLDLEVSGIYQDVTSGGLTAKLAADFPENANGYVLYASGADNLDVGAITEEYTEAYPAAKVYPMETYTQQTLSYVVNAFSMAAWISLALTLGVAALITYLYLSMRLSRDRQRSGVLASLGFSGGELAWQTQFKTILMVAPGVAAGLLLTATAGEALVGGAMSLTGFGITELQFFPNHALVHVLFPVLLIAAGALAAYIVSLRLRSNDTSAWLKG
ncbi:MAG: FtsX-like permease family protein [Gulosibacter sp.]|uniref:ABC transporter permease n=1 Tax=Gulosibacter sp. TaxID=2817531 RepID=UPI003F8E7263